MSFSRFAAVLGITTLLVGCGEPAAPPAPVEAARISHIEVGASAGVLATGETMRLLGRLLDERGDAVAGSLAWHSSDTTVAAITDSGLVRAMAEGSTTVTATGGDVSASVTLLVRSPEHLSTLVNFDAAGGRLTRFDVAGDAIDLHGGEIRFFDGLYYWYGEHYSCGFQWTTPGTPFCGFRVYSSPDLVRWTDRGALFEPDEQWQAWCDGRANGCFRPHVARVPATGRYVLWINAYDADGGYWRFESASPAGPFERQIGAARLSVAERPNRGDANLFVDDDGTGYFAYTNWATGGDVVVEQLAPDLLGGAGKYVSLGLSHVEAPSLFKRGDRYYLTVSDPNCGYCTTGTSYLTARSPLGPWSERRRITATSCGGQPAHVSTLPAAGGGIWYLFQSDLWNAGELNEATAGQFWAPLAFDASGEILPIRCDPSTRVPVEPAPVPVESTLGRLACDVGGLSGKGQRELRFVASGSRLREVTLTLYLRGARNSPERGAPDAPLVVELVRKDGGSVLARADVAASRVAWSARRVTVPLDAALEPGVSYAVRLRAATSRGCYGVATHLGAPANALASFASGDGGASWRATSDAPRASLVLEP